MVAKTTYETIGKDGRRVNVPLVSVVMPLYNAAPYVSATVESIIAQTVDDWELIIVDDGSTDGSAAIVHAYSKDARIRLVEHDENRGAAAARRTGVGCARGRYLAFLDADDLWYPHKLERQLDFMGRNEYGMCFTSYETIEENGRIRNTIHVPRSIDYRGFLKNTVTCSHSIMFDTEIVDIDLLLYKPPEDEFDYPEDLAVWLNVLKTGIKAYGLDEVLAQYRKHPQSRSANPFAAASRTWHQYRNREHLALPTTAYCLFWQLFHAALKRL